MLKMKRILKKLIESWKQRVFGVILSEKSANEIK